MCALRLAFMGTPDFSVPTLSELIAAGHEVAAVYTQPPRKSGRGQKQNLSPVHAFAEQAGLDVRTPVNFKPDEEKEKFEALSLDVAVVVAYGLILPKRILDAPRLGCLNLHASLLPRWRGAAPIQRAIMAGDKETGVMVMQMERGLDTGPVLLAERTPIGPATTAGALHDTLSHVGASLLVRALAALERGGLVPTPQGDAGVTYAEKISKAEARIDWSKPAAQLDCEIRGLLPAPGAWFEVAGKRVKVLEAVPGNENGAAPGMVLDDTLTVACGSGTLSIRRVQREGKAPSDTQEFLRGFAIPKGTQLPLSSDA